MGKPRTAQAIATWAENQAAPANSPKYHRITADQRKVMRDLRKLNTSQVEIARVLGVSQGTVSKWLAEMEDTTTEATEYLAASALRMAENVVLNGQARDHVQVLKGLKVLAEDNSTVKIAIGISLPGMPIQSVGATPTPSLSPVDVDANS